MIAPPILSFALALVATTVSATATVTAASGKCVCHLGYAAIGEKCRTHDKLVLINGVCTLRNWAKFNLKMNNRLNEDIVEATKVLRQKLDDLDSVKQKDVDVQARIKVTQQGNLRNPLRLGLSASNGCDSQKFTRCSFSLSDTAPQSTLAADLATTTSGAMTGDTTKGQIVQNAFHSDKLYYDVSAEVDLEGSRVQTLVNAAESLVDELRLANLLLVRRQESGEMTKPGAENLQVTTVVTKSSLEVDIYIVANAIVNDLEDTTGEWLEPHADTLANDFKSAAKVTESSEFSFAVITSSGETKSTGGTSYNVNQNRVKYVFNPALVYGFAIGGTLIALIGIGACLSAILIPKCLKKREKKNAKVHVEQYEDYE